MNTLNETPSTPTRRRRRFWLTATVAGVIGATALGACGHHRHGGWRGHGGEPTERITKAVDHIFSKVDASDEQKAKINEIAQAAFQELAPLRGEMRTARTEALEILTAEQVDRTALESLRSQRMASANKATETATKAMADIAEVLTPAQRVQVREKIAARMSKRWHRHHK